ncbi:uncharacterized protein LOC120843587 [Ixodes scapularis]|uniref:uncharacterized protein LOC120843587 n=1 Tax=Ixodes scapularis TaxID=6945 RepID=UPI001A9FDD60|nr:uncharacterized protein LOC120843587 [Ixodes scapularis]
MYLQSLLVIFCLLIFSHSQGTAEVTTLPEDDPKNFKEQNAKKLVELGGTHWVKKRTYEVTTPMGNPTCEYAKIYGETTTGDGYTLELGAKLGSKWTSKNQTLLFKTTGQHPAPNVLLFSRLQADGPLGHPLLYSDYKVCHIVRILKKDSPDYRCDLLLTNEAAKESPPAACEAKFQEYCKGPWYESYKSNCDETGPKTS